MNPSIVLIIPVALGWALMILVLGPLIWGARNLSVAGIHLRARLAVAVAVQRLEARLYERLGGESPAGSG